MCHPDALSRLPTPSSNTGCIPGSIIRLINFMSLTPLSAELVKKYIQRDPVLSQVCQFVQDGPKRNWGNPSFHMSLGSINLVSRMVCCHGALGLLSHPG